MENNTRGEVGKSTAGNRVKARYSKSGKHVSLKQFARGLVKAGDQDATDWFAAKAGALDLSRSDKNKTRVALEKSMTKAAKSKKK
jgi:hypothetical protein